MKKTISVLILMAGSMFAAETITGLLMDASCSTITSTPKAGGDSTSAANKPTPATAGPADASATGTTGAASNDAAGTGVRRSKAAPEPDRSMRGRLRPLLAVCRPQAQLVVCDWHHWRRRGRSSAAARTCRAGTNTTKLRESHRELRE